VIGVRKAVILAAGLGTRLLPFTKEMPKEMVPVYDTFDGQLVVKPLVQVIFEGLYRAGIREFCFVVGRGKEALMRHFAPDWSFVELLERKGKELAARCLKSFYEKVNNSSIVWVHQQPPLGTGHAVLRAKHFASGEPFVVCAGDSLFLGRDVFGSLLKAFGKYGSDFMTVVPVDRPERFGVVIGEEVEDSIMRVRRIVEKPKEPVSNLANMSCYVFYPEIFKYLEALRPSPRGEYELTAAIMSEIEDAREVYALRADGVRALDVGTPHSLIKAISASYSSCLGGETR